MIWKPIGEHCGTQKKYLGWSKEDGILPFRLIEDEYCTGFESSVLYPDWRFLPTMFAEYEEPEDDMENDR